MIFLSKTSSIRFLCFSSANFLKKWIKLSWNFINTTSHPTFQILSKVRLFPHTTFSILICRLGKMRTRLSIWIWARWWCRKGGFMGVLFVLVESTVWNTDYHSRTVNLPLCPFCSLSLSLYIYIYTHVSKKNF